MRDVRFRQEKDWIMKTVWDYVLLVVCAILLVAGFGCEAFSRYLTPAEIDSGAVDYVVESGAGSKEEFDGYGNLAKADKLKRLVDAAHQTNQFEFERLAQGDKMKYAQLFQVVSYNRQRALAFEEAIFSATGLLPIGLTAIGAGGLAGFVGLLRKRPGDYTEEELKEATAKTNKRFQELVIGINKMFAAVNQYDADGLTDEEKERVAAMRDDLIKAFKNELDAVQDTDTQIAVSALKKQLNI